MVEAQESLSAKEVKVGDGGENVVGDTRKLAELQLAESEPRHRN